MFLGGAMQYPVNLGFRFLPNLRIVLASQLKQNSINFSYGYS